MDLIGDHIAVVFSPRKEIRYEELWEDAFRYIAYLDGTNVGLVRRPDQHIPCWNKYTETILKASEDDVSEWYISPEGNSLIRGTRRNPALKMSSVHPGQLALAMHLALTR